MMVRIPMIWLILALLFGSYVLARIFSNRHSSGPSGWSIAGRAFRGVAICLLIFGGLMFAFMTFRFGHHVEVSRVESLHREMTAARVRVQQAERTIDEVWNGINRPRIPIDEPEMAASEVGAAHAAAAAQLTEMVGHPSGASEVVVGHLRIADSQADATGQDGSGTQREGQPDAIQKTGKTEREKPAEIKIARITEPTTEPLSVSDPAERPEWVDHPPKRIGNTQRLVLQSQPYRTVNECYQHDLNDQLIEAVQQRLSEMGDSRGAEFEYQSLTTRALFRGFQIGLDFIRRDICQEEYVETVEFDFAPMKRVHLLLEFDSSVDEELRDAWQRHIVRERIALVIAAAILGLLLLSLVYGLLKLDTWTRGYYSKRLFLGVPAAILALLLLMVVLSS
jgi:hypothetical protein